MRYELRICALALLVGCGASFADTIHLKNGVRVDGTVLHRLEDRVIVQVGTRRVTLQAADVRTIEKNDRTGAFDRAKAIEEAKKRDAELTAKTGLNAQQRRLVKRLLEGLISHEDYTRRQAVEQLAALAAECDIVKYLTYLLPSLLPRYVPGVLDVLVEVDPARAKPVLRREAAHLDAASRAQALELLTKIRDYASMELMARGLLDHVPRVRVSAAVSLAVLNVKQATPLLLQCLSFHDKRVREASRLALQRIWRESEGALDLTEPEQWYDFWAEHKESITVPLFDADTLTPLVEPGVEFVDE